MSDDSFLCECCGQKHSGLPTDQGFQLPDEVHELGYVERYRRSRSNSDLCTLDESRYFLRAVIPLAFTEKQGSFNWGVWVEVSKEDHDWYAEDSEFQKSGALRFSGKVANDIPGYGCTLGLEVDVQSREDGYRPFLYFRPDACHGLAHEQRGGVSNKRHHDILETVGFFDQEEDDV